MTSQFFIVVFHKVVWSRSLGVVIHLNAVQMIMEEIFFKNQRDWNILLKV